MFKFQGQFTVFFRRYVLCSVDTSRKMDTWDKARIFLSLAPVLILLILSSMVLAWIIDHLYNK